MLQDLFITLPLSVSIPSCLYSLGLQMITRHSQSICRTRPIQMSSPF
jgi:hypothetical protein